MFMDCLHKDINASPSQLSTIPKKKKNPIVVYLGLIYNILLLFM